jgi:hypothetical protein
MQKFAQVKNTVKVFDMPIGSWRKKKRSHISTDIMGKIKGCLKKLKYCFTSMRQKSTTKEA